ncbi:hypothetical protein ABT008_05000 [Micromonospora sp. NPDC002389]|uniref:hypothetical protein n=1 Tax=Micromonospora sp. NPDC002389 TaxID=3154272 RepID=UPI00331F8116
MELVDGGSSAHPGSALSAAIANRVASVITIFFGRMYGLGNTDKFDITQGVESRWRELAGFPQSEKLIRQVRSHALKWRERLVDADSVGAPMVVSTIDAVRAVIDTPAGQDGGVAPASAAALQVALHFDRTTVAAPEGSSSWAAYELKGQASLFDMVASYDEGFTQSGLHDLRNESGAQSLVYRSAMKALLQPRR